MPVTHRIIGTGITKRITTDISFETYGEEESTALERMTEAFNKNTLENYLADWEGFCQSLLAKEQPPPWNTAVYVDADGNWTEDIPKDRPKNAQPGTQITSTFLLVEDRYGIDSELWFACGILKAIDHVREAIASDDCTRAAWAGVELSRLTTLAAFKFTWEPHIELGLSHRRASSKGGRARAADKQDNHAKWQAEANRIVARQPQMPWKRVCEKVAARFGMSPSTVKKYIRKPRE
jgi:hypothetical protein